MNYLHSELKIGPEEIVEVILDKQANVRLLDDNNYYYYKNELKFHGYGGLAKNSPVHISPPEEGVWHMVIDLGEESGTVKSTLKLVNEKRFVEQSWLCTETAKEKKPKKGEKQGIWGKLFSKK